MRSRGGLRILKKVVSFRPLGSLDTVPVTRHDYPFDSDRYIEFERKMSRIIPAFVLPNHLTLFRLAACTFLLWNLSSLSPPAFFLIVLLAGASDFFDGVVARARGQKTRLGILLDPLADKLLVATVLLMLLQRGTIDTRILLLILSGEAHLILVPVASYLFPFDRNGERRQRITAEGIKPVVCGRIKLFLYLSGLNVLIFGLVTGDEAFAAWGRHILLLGVCCSWMAVIGYLCRWVKLTEGRIQ
jgi:phosphatidylglycerophosphate synthase